MKYTFNCKQNDAVLEFTDCDGKVDEVCLRDPIDGGCWIIGFNDLEKGIAEAKKAFREKMKNPDIEIPGLK